MILDYHWDLKASANTSVEHATRDYYLNTDIKSSIDEFNKKLPERLYDGNFQVNADVDGKFYFILLE